MANLIKNALVKQISKFLKNVSPNQINISTLKGEGEMKNIQLNEEMLMNVLEIPTWLRITNARCNKASVKIQWTKLKTNPIVIILDKIELDMEIADPLREYNMSSDLSSMFDKDSGGAYGFIDKCIDAIQLIIDSITITIKSKTFNANLNMSNIRINSVTPNWKMTNDIRNTRLKDLEKDEIILFKEVSWEICRLEAFNIETGSQNQTATSIKLIMNPSKIRIVLKKKLSDKSLINSTIRILLNEIYWMASDTQLKAAIGTYKTLSKLMTKSFEQKKKYVHIQQQQSKSSAQNKNLNTSDKSSNDILSKVFLQYDIKETSLHVQISNLNIHLYADDNYSGNKLIDGGSIQFLFKNLCLDHYPYHKVGSSTKHWNNYNHTFRQRDEWSKNLLNEFTSKLEDIFKKSNLDRVNKSQFKNGINLLESCTIFSLKDFSIYKVTTNLSNKQANMSSMRAKKVNQEKTDSNPVTYDSINDFLKLKNYFLDQQMFNMRPFLSSNSLEFNLPSETLFANCFFSDFYFPENVNYPVPCPQVFVQISPILLNVDFLTLLWMNTLAFSLWREKLLVDQNDKSDRTSFTNQLTKNSLHCDTHLEVILPKVNLTIYPTKFESNVNFQNENFTTRPNSIEIGMAKLVLTNKTLGKYNNYFDEFKKTSEKSYKLSSSLIEKNTKFKNKFKNLFENNEIKVNKLAPCFKEIVKNDDFCLVRHGLEINAELNKFNQMVNAKEGLFLKILNKNALNKDAAKDIWTMDIESLWIDMIDKENMSFVQNASFKIFVANVWEFLSKSSILLEKHDLEKKWNESSNGNYLKAYKRLERVIEIQKEEEFSAKVRKRSNSLSNKCNLIKSKAESELLCKKIYSNLNVLSRVKNINVFVNHSQILFLFRLIDVVENFFNQIKIDTEHILKFKGNSQKTDEIGKKTRPKSFKLDFLDESIDQNRNEPSVNLALWIDSIQVELLLDDLRKDIRFQPEYKNEREESHESDIFEEKKSNENLDSSIDDYNVVTKQIDKDLIINYIKYIYGLNTEVPNFSFNFNLLPSSKDFPREQHSTSDSGYVTEKSSLASSLSFKALNGLNKLTNKLSESGEDLLADDNDNISMIMSLAQEDAISVVSENMCENLKSSPNRSMSSASETSSFTTSTGQINKLDQLKTNSSCSNLSKFTTSVNQIIQTDSAKTKVGIGLKNLDLYVQTEGENLLAMITFDQVKIRDRKSENFDDNKLRDIFIRFEKVSNNFEKLNGLAEIFAENFKFELDVPTLTAIVDLIEDTDDFKIESKDTIAIKGYINSCGVKLNDDPFKTYVNNPKILDIFVDSLIFEKLSDNRILINEIRPGKSCELDPHSLKLKLTKSLFHESKYVLESKSDFSSVEFRSRQNFKIDPSKFASMVLMLRKEKELNHSLQAKFEKQKLEQDKRDKEMGFKIEAVENENNNLKKEIERLKNFVNRESIINASDEEKTSSLNEKLEIERKQFECLLLGCQQENELLKSKLKKTEDYVSLLNIERECLMKKINQSKF